MTIFNDIQRFNSSAIQNIERNLCLLVQTKLQVILMFFKIHLISISSGTLMDLYEWLTQFLYNLFHISLIVLYSTAILFVTLRHLAKVDKLPSYYRSAPSKSLNGIPPTKLLGILSKSFQGFYLFQYHCAIFSLPFFHLIGLVLHSSRFSQNFLNGFP